jgi:putative nucleotidyltransferase with HDIG domain
MRRATQIYVGVVTLGAVAWFFLLWRSTPPVTTSSYSDAALLCALAIVAEFLAYVLPQSAAGSLGFIPYFAAAIVVPSWPTVACVVTVKGLSELLARRTPIKALLNVSAHALMEMVAVTLYLRLGGVALESIATPTNLTHVTKLAAGPALLACALALLVNHVVVTVAIAISTGRRVGGVLEANNRATIGLDFLVAPLVFIFAWVYAAFGVVAAATCWIPILGLRQFHRINLELERTNEELLELMVRSLEARDAYTSGHSRRVQQYSAVIARAIGLSEREVNHVSRAALLHDVGKIHEKYAPVLAKQDKLSPEEWAIIQDHPVDGANLVATMTRLRDVVPAIRHHHENWDGTGYPDGLTGESIPLASRIIRFADTIDAMTTERPYRRPLTEDQVRNEVVRCRGTQFDPRIADTLLSSALWSTLFAPALNQRFAPKLAIVGSRGAASNPGSIRAAQ